MRRQSARKIADVELEDPWDHVSRCQQGFGLFRPNPTVRVYAVQLLRPLSFSAAPDAAMREDGEDGMPQGAPVQVARRGDWLVRVPQSVFDLPPETPVPELNAREFVMTDGEFRAQYEPVVDPENLRLDRME